MTEQSLLSRVAEFDLTRHDEAVDVLDNISRQRQRMLNLRWSVHAVSQHASVLNFTFVLGLRTTMQHYM